MEYLLTVDQVADLSASDRILLSLTTLGGQSWGQTFLEADL